MPCFGIKLYTIKERIAKPRICFNMADGFLNERINKG